MRSRYRTPLFLSAAAVARTGDDMSGPALLLVGLAATGSAASASALLGALTVTAAVGGPAVGVLLDRSPRPGRLLAGALAGYAAALAVLVLAIGRAPSAVCLLVAGGAGLLGPAVAGGWTARLPEVVGEKGLARASAWDALTYNVAGLAGPALAGVVATVGGAGAAVGAAVALVGCAAPVAWGLRAARGAGGRVVGADPTAGVMLVVRHPPLRRATSTSVLTCAGEGALVATVPLLAARTLGGAHLGAAVLLPAVALSALAANAVLARRPALLRPDTVLGYGPLLTAAALLTAAVAGHPAVLVAAVILLGLVDGPQLTALFAVRHRETPAGLLARVVTTGASLKLTAFGCGAALGGLLADRSVTVALTAAAALHLLAAAVHAALGRRPEEREGPADGERRPARPDPRGSGG
ncbi:MFS transporter [Streptomyces sp. NPDC060194]|uniref:MFS transporter n=1 Tax=Streptomyces sp. NPDC060194 TaxID=3347069 RepID=UPI003665A0C2